MNVLHEFGKLLSTKKKKKRKKVEGVAVARVSIHILLLVVVQYVRLISRAMIVLPCHIITISEADVGVWRRCSLLVDDCCQLNVCVECCSSELQTKKWFFGYSFAVRWDVSRVGTWFLPLPRGCLSTSPIIMASSLHKDIDTTTTPSRLNTPWIKSLKLMVSSLRLLHLCSLLHSRTSNCI